jgi:hypothetical protein
MPALVPTIPHHDAEPVALSAVRLRSLPSRQRAAQDRGALRDAIQRMQSVQCDASKPCTVRCEQHGEPEGGGAAGRCYAHAAEAMNHTERGNTLLVRAKGG